MATSSLTFSQLEMQALQLNSPAIPKFKVNKSKSMNPLERSNSSRTPFPTLNSNITPGNSNQRSSTARSAAVQERNYTGSSNGALFGGVLETPPKEKKEVSKEVVTERPMKAEDIVSEPLIMSTGKLIDKGMVYRENFVIRCYEVGVNRTASIESIANLLQEIGCNHAQSVGFSNDGFATTTLMRKKRLIWVTTRMHIEMDRYPVWGDCVEIDTWFQGEGSIVSRRDWIIRMAGTGEVIGRGTSTWVTMNKDTRRLSRVPDDVRAEYMQHCPDPPRFALPSEPSDKIPKLEDPAESVVPYLRPRRGDLDMNRHVNNVTYIGWMLESIPSPVLKVAELAKITLEYRREVNGGEMVESLASPEVADIKMTETREVAVDTTTSENGAVNVSTSTTVTTSSVETSSGGLQFIHLLRLQDAENEINRGRTVWREKAVCTAPVTGSPE